jgi:hypothetical protein
LEAAFGDNPYAASPTWTDISAYARSLTLSRGRSHERDQVKASTLSVVLSNDDGRFDPSYTTGAYYPDVVLNVPIRLRATYNLTTYDLFYGFADAWPQTWPSMKDATVRLSATDGFKFLANAVTSTVEAAEKSGTRIGNLLDDASWPAGWRSLSTGEVTCPSYGRDNGNVLDLIRQVEKSEAGLFFISGDGTATFWERYHRSQTATQATFGDSGAELRYQGLEVGFDDTQLWNDVEVVRTGQSAVQTHTDAASVTANGKRTLRQNDVLVSTDAEAAGLAELLADVYGTQDLRVRRLSTMPRRDPSGMWPVVLGLELSDEVVVNRRPPAGNTITETLYVEGISHTVDAASKSWTTSLSLSHYTPGGGPFLELNDATDGKLNTGQLGY